tara:strand:+ start:4779 stop:5732 length:954 start_codon:yes stop_codon:yes gene_type:complete
MLFKKPNFWDQKKLSFFSILLLPFTIPIRLNNILKDKSSKFSSNRIISLCVGNIYLGGTGKTPTTIKLYEIIKNINSKSIVTAKKSNIDHYDEINLLKSKTNFITAPSRKEILLKAIKRKTKVIIFDDGLQDKNIDYNLKIVCFDADRWIGNGQLIPSGPLREKIESLKKFDLVFIKNENFKNLQFNKTIKKINPSINIFYSKYKITNLNRFNLNKKYLIFSGVGDPTNFEKILKKKNFKIIKHLIFPDHYGYKKSDFLNIINKAIELNCKIITTEKDYMKVPKSFKNKINFIKINLIIKNQNKLTNILKSIINDKS